MLDEEELTLWFLHHPPAVFAHLKWRYADSGREIGTYIPRPAAESYVQAFGTHIRTYTGERTIIRGHVLYTQVRPYICASLTGRQLSPG